MYKLLWILSTKFQHNLFYNDYKTSHARLHQCLCSCCLPVCGNQGNPVETHLSGQNMHGDHMTISLVIAEYRTLVAAVRGKHITYGQARQQ